MRINAYNGVEGRAWASANQRVQIQLGVHRITATPAEATEFARRVAAAAERAEAGEVDPW
ncbi:MAG: hypothetical protein HYZ39_22310 [Mycolicibacterium cosmeticum]|nr:hypothetical protein [Mycolicibacterium cosmeticum]